MEQNIEKRKLDRAPFSYTVLFEIDDARSSRSNVPRTEGCGLDISSSGIGILSDRLLSKGDVVKLYTPLRDTNTIIPTTSEVCWTAAAEGRYRLGFKFLF